MLTERIRLRVGFLLALFAWACVLGFARATQDTPATKIADESVQHKITPGKGLRTCSIGQPANVAVSLFGKPDKEDDRYIHFSDKGVIAGVEDGKIVALFFVFRSKKEVTFDGETDKGVGMWSTIPTVLKKYGKPSHLSDTVVSEFGAMPGARDYTLEYAQAGISFTFYDNELGFVSVFEPKP